MDLNNYTNEFLQEIVLWQDRRIKEIKQETLKEVEINLKNEIINILPTLFTDRKYIFRVIEKVFKELSKK